MRPRTPTSRSRCPTTADGRATVAKGVWGSMTTMWGADADQLEELARDLLTAGHRLDEICRRLGGQLGSAPWKGSDAERFRHDWQRKHVPALVAASRLLGDASTRLSSNARDQRQASTSSDGAGTATAMGLAGASPSAGTRVLTHRAENTRASMEAQLASLQEALRKEEQSARTSPVEFGKGVMPFMTTDAERLKERIGVLDALLSPGRTYLTFSDSPGDNRIIEVMGDITSAKHVIVHVPGISTDLDDYRNGNHDATALLRAAQDKYGDDVAVISFLDYNVPTGQLADHKVPDLGEAASLAGAKSGEASLRDLVHELSTDGRQVSVVAHSYGTVVVGQAMQHGLDADRVVVLGSPGMGAQDRASLGSPDVHLIAGSSPVDPWAVGAPDVWGKAQALGDPVTYSPTFGPNPIEYADHVDVTGAHGHSEYFTGRPLENIVAAALGSR